MNVQSFTCLARILTELFEKNEIQFGPTEEMYGRKTVLVYARPTGKNTMTESNKKLLHTRRDRSRAYGSFDAAWTVGDAFRPDRS